MSPKDARHVLTQELEAVPADAEHRRALTIALARIEVGEWGTCAACRRAIDAERLTAQPTATHCASCDVIVLDDVATGEWFVAPVADTQAPQAV